MENPSASPKADPCVKRLFRRKIYGQMLKWKERSQGRKALLIEGPRQVGKTAIVREFARREYRSCLFIDFANCASGVKEAFSNPSDPDLLFATLLALTGSGPLFDRQSVVLFDNVQCFPRARQAVKHLVQDGRYDFIEAGCMACIHSNVKDILIPSEEEELEMRPMDFEEFCLALGRDEDFPLMRSLLDKAMPFGAAGSGSALYRSIAGVFRLYLMVGGMPGAVDAYLRTRDLESADRVKRGILSLIMQDFDKHDPSGTAKAIFKAIPEQVAGGRRCFSITAAAGRIPKGKAGGIMELLRESKACLTAWRALDPITGLQFLPDLNAFRLFICDTGLFITLAYWDRLFSENKLYALLSGVASSADLKGACENAAAQMLAASGNRLFFYAFKAPDGHLQAIDFLLSRGGKICPVEVENRPCGRRKSMDDFCLKFKRRIGQSFLLHDGDLARENGLLAIPLFMAPLI